MKKIGIIGGVSWISTLEYYKYICELSHHYQEQRLPGGPPAVPEMVIELNRKNGKSELLGMMDATRNEEGCVKFELHESECSNYIYLYEEWLNKDALENHHNQEHTKMVAAKFESWLGSPTEVSFMKKL